MSLRDYVASLPPERRDEVLAGLDGLPEPEGNLGDLFEQAAYERSVALDPAGQRVSRVLIRLSGDATAEGALDDASASEIVGAFGREVRAAAGDHADDAKLRLVGYSAGSVVLHYEPVKPEIEEGADGAMRVHSVADHAIETVLDLHKAIESGVGPDEIRARFQQPGLLKAARTFLKVLDKDRLDLSARWYGPTGAMSRSVVSDVGRRYALDTLFSEGVEHEPELLSGMVTAMDLEGYVTIRSGKRKPIVKVPEELVLDGSFQIGRFTHIRATKTYTEDKVGITGKASYEFIDFAFSEGDTPLEGLDR